jgi:hypothetical protein
MLLAFCQQATDLQMEGSQEVITGADKASKSLKGGSFFSSQNSPGVPKGPGLFSIVLH